MKKHVAFSIAAVMGVGLVSAFADLRAHTEPGETPATPPVVFQAAGPTVASIQSMVDAFRASLGANNGNVTGPIVGGRREINWDGGGSTATSLVPTPFDGFLLTRGARFTTRGSGFVQAPVDGLAGTFGNPTYARVFQAFSPVRLFSAVDSTVTDARFFVPGGGELPATTQGFGAILSDVDLQGQMGDDRRGHGGSRRAATTLSFYGVDGRVLYEAVVPASTGDASLSFLGVRFDDARIARVRIRAGNAVPRANDTDKRDVVMMDDFVFGEPQPVDDADVLRALALGMDSQ